MKESNKGSQDIQESDQGLYSETKFYTKIYGKQKKDTFKKTDTREKICFLIT